MAGAHAAGARVGMDQLLRALGRLVQRRELGPQKLEVAHRFPLQDFPATTLLRANMTEPAPGMQARGRTPHRAHSATAARSEAPSVGKGWVSTIRTRWGP